MYVIKRERVCVYNVHTIPEYTAMKVQYKAVACSLSHTHTTAQSSLYTLHKALENTHRTDGNFSPMKISRIFRKYVFVHKGVVYTKFSHNT